MKPLRVTHGERVVFPRAQISKLEVVRGVELLAPYLFPHIDGRPLALVRCPEGIRGECFFQKHLRSRPPAGVSTIAAGGDQHIVVTRIEGIAALAQYGALEMHSWGARSPRIDRPDQLTLDFDPDPKLAWPRVLEAALAARTLLEQLGLAAFVKTTGGKGLHVVTPLRPARPWSEVKAFARGLAQTLVGAAPERFTALLSKDKRRGKIFVDYLRNGEGATAIAPYSLRAREGAPVAIPWAWDVLDAGRDVRGAVINLRNVGEHLAAAQAAWSDFDAQRRAITSAMRKTVGL